MKKYRENTNTEKNLHNALSSETLNLAKYMIWGEKAEKDGYPQISECYKTAARNGIARSRIWMSELGMLENEEGGLNQYLQMAANSEKDMSEKSKISASAAEDEGYDELKEKFLDASRAYESQMHTFEHTNKSYISDNMFVSQCDKTLWRCYNCGYTSEGEYAPSRCPLCGRGETWFIPTDNSSGT